MRRKSKARFCQSSFCSRLLFYRKPGHSSDLPKTCQHLKRNFLKNFRAHEIRAVSAEKTHVAAKVAASLRDAQIIVVITLRVMIFPSASRGAWRPLHVAPDVRRGKPATRTPHVPRHPVERGKPRCLRSPSPSGSRLWTLDSPLVSASAARPSPSQLRTPVSRCDGMIDFRRCPY